MSWSPDSKSIAYGWDRDGPPDIYVLAVDGDGRAAEIAHVEGRPSGLGWLPDGSLLVVSMLDRRVLRRSASGALRVHADLSAHCEWHANDMVVAADGSAYVGNFGFDLAAGAEPKPSYSPVGPRLTGLAATCFVALMIAAPALVVRTTGATPAPARYAGGHR